MSSFYIYEKQYEGGKEMSARTETLKAMITDYKNNGDRVDEVLYQEVMRIAERSQELEKENQRLYKASIGDGNGQTHKT